MTVDAAMRRAGAAFLSWLPIAGRDALGLAGLSSIAYGCWLLAPAAGFIVGGVEAVAICALATAAAGAR
jgi:hypothetical protein